MTARASLFLGFLFLASVAFAQQPDLTLKVTPIGPGLAPWPTRFEFTVTNNGAQRATNVRLTSPDDIDPLSEWANPTCSRQMGEVRWLCTAAVLEPGQSAQFAGNIGPAPATQPYTFHFSVRADEADANPADNDVAVPIDWAEPDDISVDFIPPDPLGESRAGRLVIENRSDWVMDYVRFELSFRNAKRLVSTTPALQCRDAWGEPIADLVWLNCEMRGIPAHAKQEIVFEFELPEQSVEFDVKVTWWLYSWRERESVVYARPFLVTNTADSGAGSLRQALADANAQCTKEANIACRVVFAIDEPVPQNGWFTIHLQSPLPDIRARWLSIDGFTQLRKSGDTNPLGPDIELDGRQLQSGDALVFYSDRSEVLGLAIGGFPRHGIVIEREQPYDKDLSFPSVIWHNYVGIDPTGGFARPNGGRGVVIHRGSSLIEGNVLSGNVRSGVFIDAQNANIRNNRIGTRAFDDTPVPNGASGIFIGQRSAGYGSANIEANVIAHNAQFGVALAPRSYTVVRNNRIFGNVNPGIDIGLDGPGNEVSPYTPPAPRLTNIVFDGMQQIVTGYVPSVPGQISATPWTVGIYASSSDRSQGEQYLGEATVNSDGTFTFATPIDIRGRWINASAIFAISFFSEYQLYASSEFSGALRVSD